MRRPLNLALSIHLSILLLHYFLRGATYYFFLIFCFSKSLKVMEPLFWGNFLCPKWVNGAFLGQNAASMNALLNVFIRFFWNLPDVRYLKVGKMIILNFYEKFFPKVTLLNFSLNLFIRFLWNCTWLQSFKRE